MSRFVVNADPDLSDLIPGFLEHKRDDLAAIVRAIEDADYETLAPFGHKIKGEGGSYGLDRISEIGARLMSLPPRATWRRFGNCAAIRDFLDNVEVVLNDRDADVSGSAAR